MLISSLKKYTPFGLIVFFITAILLWIRPIINSDLKGIYIDSNPTLIYNGIVYLIGSDSFNLLCKIFAFLLVSIQALIFNEILNQSNLLGSRNYLPGIIFLLLSSVFVGEQLLQPILFSNIFLLFAWERIIGSSEKQNFTEAYFNGGFFIGLATLFYPNFIYFLAILFFSIVMNRVGKFREAAMVFSGFALVWYFYLSIFYLIYDKIEISGIEFDFSFSFLKFHKLLLIEKIILGYTILLILVASFKLSTFISNLKIQLRRNQKFLFLWFITGIFLLLVTNSNTEIIYLLSFPSAALLSTFFVNIQSKWIKEVLWFLLLILILINQIFPQLIA
jgi:hypothetical protein